MKKVNPSAQRNKDPILDVLKSTVGTESPLCCLEIASGSGTHVGHFAHHLPNVTWQPTDFDVENMESLRAYKSEHSNILEPIVLDVSRSVELENFRPDFLLCINMIHISPWAATLGLFANAGKVLRPSGKLVTYGPYAQDGVLAPESNQQFDLNLRSRDPSWGIRDVTELKEVAAVQGLQLDQVIEMPANNKTLVFVKK